MNIFILSTSIDPIKHHANNARFHCDRHVVKMIAESTQMLASALAFGSKTLRSQLPTYLPSSVADALPCKPLSASMLKHPCTVWTAASINNLNYLACLAASLCEEHSYRYPLSIPHAYSSWLSNLLAFLSDKGFGLQASLPTHFAVAIKDPTARSSHTAMEDAVKLYRSYYAADKHSFATWKRRDVPLWFLQEVHSQGIDANTVKCLVS